MKTIDDTLLIPQLEAGEKLYHYTSAAGLQGIASGEFWITEHSFLNDYTEFQVATEVFSDVLDMHMENKANFKKVQHRVVHEVKRLQAPALSTKQKVAYAGDFVISFCLDYDSPLMWSSYSAHAGYCIQFDYENLRESFAQERKAFLFDGKVVYDHSEQVALMEETIKRSYFEDEHYPYLNSWDDFDKMTEESLNDWYMAMAMEVDAYNIFFKLPCFKGENEYRFVFSVCHDGGRYKEKDLWKQYFRVKDEVLIPYIKMPMKNIDSIDRILIGAKNKSDLAAMGARYMFRNLKHDVVVEKSEIPLRY